MHRLLLETLGQATVLSLVALIWTAFSLPRPSTGWLIVILAVAYGIYVYFRTELLYARAMIEEAVSNANRNRPHGV